MKKYGLKEMLKTAGLVLLGDYRKFLEDHKVFLATVTVFSIDTIILFALFNVLGLW